MKRSGLLQAVFLAFMLVWLMPSAVAAESDAGQETMTIGIGITLDTLDPAQQTTTTVMNVIDYGLQTLLSFDAKGELQPLLATSWDWSDGGKTLTLMLREGVTFHDGTPFNAKAVKFSLGRLLSDKVKVRIGAAYQVIDSIEIVKPYVVRLHLKQPQPTLLPNLAATMAAMISPSAVGKNGNTYADMQNPVGTGAYELVDRVRGSKLVFKRYKDYWGKAPYYDTVLFKIIPEANALEAGLLAGQLDMIMNPPVADLKSLEARDDLTVLKAPSDRSIFIAFVNSHPPFDNKKVRQAFNYAVNKQAIIDHVLFGAAKRMNSPFTKAMFGYCKVGGYDYDPQKAKQLLAEAGATNLTVRMGTPRGRYTQDFQASQAIASYLRQVGVDVKLSTMDWASYVGIITTVQDTYDLFMLGWAPMALDAPTQMQMFTEASWPPNGLGVAFYSDAKVQKLYKQAKSTIDNDKRAELYCQIQKIMWDDAPWLFLWSQYLILAYDNDITGISYQPNEKFVTIYAHPTDVEDW